MSASVSAALTTKDGPSTPPLTSSRRNSVRYGWDGLSCSSSVAKTRLLARPRTTHVVADADPGRHLADAGGEPVAEGVQAGGDVLLDGRRPCTAIAAASEWVSAPCVVESRNTRSPVSAQAAELHQLPLARRARRRRSRCRAPCRTSRGPASRRRGPARRAADQRKPVIISSKISTHAVPVGELAQALQVARRRLRLRRPAPGSGRRSRPRGAAAAPPRPAGRRTGRTRSARSSRRDARVHRRGADEPVVVGEERRGRRTWPRAAARWRRGPAGPRRWWRRSRSS